MTLVEKCTEISNDFPFLTESEVVHIAIQALILEELKKFNLAIADNDRNVVSEWLTALGNQ